MGFNLLSAIGGAASQKTKEWDAEREARLKEEQLLKQADLQLRNSMRVTEFEQGIKRRNKEDAILKARAAFQIGAEAIDRDRAPLGTNSSDKTVPSTGKPSPSQVSAMGTSFDRPLTYGAPSIESSIDLNNEIDYGVSSYKDKLIGVSQSNKEYNDRNRTIKSEYGQEGLVDFHLNGYKDLNTFDKSRGQFWKVKNTYGSEAGQSLKEYVDRGGSAGDWEKTEGAVYLTKKETELNKAFNESISISDYRKRGTGNVSDAGDINKFFKDGDLKLVDVTNTPGWEIQIGEESRGEGSKGTLILRGLGASQVIARQSNSPVPLEEEML
jgi:hypothetical protein